MKADIFVDENGLRHYIRDGLHITLNHTNKDISVTRNETAMFSRQTNEDGTKTYLYFDSNIEENNEYRIVSYSDIFVIIHKNNSDAIQIKHGNISLITWQ
jgi:hypothetical protein